MRKYKKEEEQYFTEYDPSKFYGCLNLTAYKGKRYLLLATEYCGNEFYAYTLESTANSIGHFSFNHVCVSKHWQVFEFDTRKELLEWLLEEHK